MDNSDRKTNIFVKLLEYSGTLTVVGVIAAWFFSINSFNSYFASFFIDASQLVSFSIIWQFASQKLLTLINVSIIIIIIFVCLLLIIRDLRKAWIPPRQIPSPNVRIKPKLNAVFNVFALLLSVCLVSLIIILTMLLNGGAGTFRALIDQDRFNNNYIIPQRITVDEVTNIIKCVSILGSFDKYTFVIYQDRKAELIKSTRILSIQPMLEPASSIETSTPLTKSLSKGLCGTPKIRYLITKKPDSYYFKVIWVLSNFILRPKDPF